MIADDLHARLAQRLAVPFYERRWGLHAPRLARELGESQYWSLERLLENQWQQLLSLVHFAHRNNSFYRRRMDAAGMGPGDLRRWEDFEKLPLLRKSDLRTNPNALLSDGYDSGRMFYKRTGGSTGEPVRLYWDEPAHRFKRAVVKRHDRWAGYALGRKLAALWGDTEKSYPWKERLYKQLCERTIYLDTLLMDEAHLEDFVDRLRRFRPRCLIGHAHSIFFFTKYAISSGADDLSFDSIISTAETLVPSERQFIESRFGKVLFDRYGCEELSLVASECEAHDGLHVAAEGLLVELVDADDQTIRFGQSPRADSLPRPARLVVTDLTNYGMPLLRYEVGDESRWQAGSCACGRGLPRLERVFGRVTDVLFAPDGRRISGVSILDTFMIHVPGVRQAQIVQDRLDHVELRVVGNASYGEISRERLTAAVREIFGPDMRHELVEVDAIAPTPRGKYQFTICEIDEPTG